MANKIIQLKSGDDNIYPQMDIRNIDNYLDFNLNWNSAPNTSASYVNISGKVITLTLSLSREGNLSLNNWNYIGDVDGLQPPHVVYFTAFDVSSGKSYLCKIDEIKVSVYINDTQPTYLFGSVSYIG